ncbi:helix-turn-helix transcriptional regulator [Jiangella mangrovi]|uniref:AraC-like DNA-binding protein n=1 Tax=Jiangella mangrovi TaxID=1524084 RepID=A0A7W9LPD8_9ACTN|nr:AraC family transcriptional regulator [Jiangella mangrovi]MBB5791201.1 AraC-like DNA-binding protein [Jiangella mangrovi]
MRHHATVLGQPIAVPEQETDEGHVLVVLADVDDFEVSRLARGDEWASRMLEAAAAAVERCAASYAPDKHGPVVAVPPDAWMVTFHGDDATELRATGRRFAALVRDRVQAACGVAVTVGISRPSSGSARVEAATAEAVSALDHKLVSGGDAVYDLAEVRSARGTGGAPVPVPDRVEERLAQCVRRGDATGAVATLRSWIDRVSAVDGVTPDVLREWLAAEVLYALEVAGQRRLSDGSTDWIAACSRLPLNEVVEMYDIHDRSYLVLWLEQLLPRIVASHEAPSPARHVLAVVERYIQDHYADDLRLVTVSEAVFVSPYYISHLFQRELGTTFLKYLTAVRMRHGRRLLADTELPVELVAEQVGYQAPKRFRELFKRTFHVTPSEYRRQVTTPVLRAVG